MEYRRTSFPELATLQGDHRFNDRWNDYSPAAHQETISHAKQVLTKLGAIDPRQLSEQDGLSHELRRRQLD
jgi:uncharacterized protein (DUF885 family)